jgi:hypothetical protein
MTSLRGVQDAEVMVVCHPRAGCEKAEICFASPGFVASSNDSQSHFPDQTRADHVQRKGKTNA